VRQRVSPTNPKNDTILSNHHTTLVNNFTPYSLTVVGNTIWAWADIGSNQDSYLTKVDPGTGNVTQVLKLPKGTI